MESNANFQYDDRVNNYFVHSKHLLFDPSYHLGFVKEVNKLDHKNDEKHLLFVKEVNKLDDKNDENEAAFALIDLRNFKPGNINKDAPCHNIKLSINDKATCIKHEQIGFHLPVYFPTRINLNVKTFQLSNEARIKYLIRSLKLWAEFMNSGDLDKLRILFNDILVEDFIFIDYNMPPKIGQQKIFETATSVLSNVPDYCSSNNKIERSKKRIITMKCNTFGTLAYINVCSDSGKYSNIQSTASWNMFESTPFDKFDEHHKIQKQKYDLLKSKNKNIMFKRRSTCSLVLSRDLKQFAKLMIYNVKVDIC